MAKSANFFGLRRGSTKSLTFQVYRGQQVTKDRVTSVTNPQSNNQMLQRLKMPLVANARSVLRTLVNHSFEGIEYGEKSLKQFSSLNLAKDALTVYEYVPKDVMDSGLANLIISQGSLTPQKVTIALTSDNKAPESFTYMTMGASADVKISDLNISTSGNAITSEQLALVCQILGISESTSQLTFLIDRVGDNYEWGETETELPANGHYHRFVIGRLFNQLSLNSNWFISNASTSGSSSGNAITAFELSDDYISLKVIYSGDTISKGEVLNAEVKLSSQFTQGNTMTIEGACVIYSRQDDNVWRRSPQRLQCVKSTYAMDYEYVLPTYLKAGSTSTKYVNNGINGVNITGGGGNVTLAVKNDESTNKD